MEGSVYCWKCGIYVSKETYEEHKRVHVVKDKIGYVPSSVLKKAADLRKVWLDRLLNDEEAFALSESIWESVPLIEHEYEYDEDATPEVLRAQVWAEQLAELLDLPKFWEA